jgi:hypothetical protein
MIEIKDGKIDAAHVADAQKDELLREAAQLGIRETSNLLVETLFIPSVLAHQNREDRLLARLREALRGGPIFLPDRLLLGRLGAKGHRQREAERQQC